MREPDPEQALPLCDNVGGQLIFDLANAIAQNEFALFQTLNLQPIRRGQVSKSVDSSVEVAMFLPQTLEFSQQSRTLFAA